MKHAKDEFTLLDEFIWLNVKANDEFIWFLFVLVIVITTG